MGEKRRNGWRVVLFGELYPWNGDLGMYVNVVVVYTRIGVLSGKSFADNLSV